MLGVCHNLGVLFLSSNGLVGYVKIVYFAFCLKIQPCLTMLNQAKLSALFAEPCQTLKLRYGRGLNIFLVLSSLPRNICTREEDHSNWMLMAQRSNLNYLE